jgi:uncharacterized protein YyaL (SSP411 family)
MTKDLYNTARSLDAWVSKNGWSGYDSKDIEGHFLASYLLEKNRFVVAKKILYRVLFHQPNIYFPSLIRKFWRIPKTVLPKAMGLFASAYLRLYLLTNDRRYKAKSKECFSWLLNNSCKGYNGLSWGLPFDIPGKVLAMPRGIPFSVVTVIIGYAILLNYKIFKNSEDIENAYLICDFLLKDLDRYEDHNGICFSYTPIDNFKIFNSSLLVADFLARVGSIMGKNELIKLSEKAALFGVRNMHRNGRLSYAYVDTKKTNTKWSLGDVYHSGFEARCLLSIGEILNNKEILAAARKMYKFICNHYFGEPSGRVFTMYTQSKLVDIHGIADALITLSHFGNDRFAKKKAENIFSWTSKNMLRKDGAFCSQVHYKIGIPLKQNIAFVRWGQAWMMEAITKQLCWLEGHKEWIG